MVPISVQKNVKAGHSLGWGHLVIEKLPLYDWIHSHRAPPVLVMWFHKAKTEMVKTAKKCKPVGDIMVAMPIYLQSMHVFVSSIPVLQQLHVQHI